MAREEIELKFHLADAAPVPAQLRRLGFRITRSRRLERNWILDTSDRRLLQSGSLLRLRRSGDAWLLTVKGPRRPGALKRRREIETAVADGPACRTLLAALGYSGVLEYRRYRTTWERPRQPGEVVWDETPMGIYIEIEGTARWVRRTARELGLRVKDAEPRSYPALYAAWNGRNTREKKL